MVVRSHWDSERRCQLSPGSSGTPHSCTLSALDLRAHSPSSSVHSHDSVETRASDDSADDDAVDAGVLLPQHLDQVADRVGHRPKDEHTPLVSER